MSANRSRYGEERRRPHALPTSYHRPTEPQGGGAQTPASRVPFSISLCLIGSYKWTAEERRYRTTWPCEGDAAAVSPRGRGSPRHLDSRSHHHFLGIQLGALAILTPPHSVLWLLRLV